MALKPTNVPASLSFCPVTFCLAEELSLLLSNANPSSSHRRSRPCLPLGLCCFSSFLFSLLVPFHQCLNNFSSFLSLKEKKRKEKLPWAPCAVQVLLYCPLAYLDLLRRVVSSCCFHSCFPSTSQFTVTLLQPPPCHWTCSCPGPKDQHTLKSLPLTF